MITPQQARAELARRELSRRGIPLEKSQMNWKQVVGQGLREAAMRPGTITRNMAVSPTAQAQVLPYLGGMAGGASPIPGGATLGTVGGRQLSNLALRTYGRPDLIPSTGQQIAEGGLSLFGDIAAIPAMKKAYYGKQIGQLEKAAKLITRAPTKAVTPGSVGETLNTLEAQIDAGLINTPQLAKDAKAVVSQIYKNPKIYEQTGEISVQSQRVSEKIQDLLNKMIPGRLGPSQAMGRAMTIPNMIRRTYRATPWAIKRGAQFMGGGYLVEEILRKLYGGIR